MPRSLAIVAAVAACLSSVGCVNSASQHAGFRRSELRPHAVQGHVGELVTFEVLPPVARGTLWALTSRGLARFVDGSGTQLDWVADRTPIKMQAVVAPWDPARHRDQGGRGWLWFGLRDGDVTEPLDVDLPVHPLPYKEIAPVTAQASFSLEKRNAPFVVQVVRDRVTVVYRTPIEDGVPLAPRAFATLVETDGKKILYAEVKTNFGERPRERVGYDVALSYSALVAGPVEVVVVEWIAHGQYSSAFDVHRTVVGGAVPSDGSPGSAPANGVSAAKPSG